MYLLCIFQDIGPICVNRSGTLAPICPDVWYLIKPWQSFAMLCTIKNCVESFMSILEIKDLQLMKHHTLLICVNGSRTSRGMSLSLHYPSLQLINVTYWRQIGSNTQRWLLYSSWMWYKHGSNSNRTHWQGFCFTIWTGETVLTAKRYPILTLWYGLVCVNRGQNVPGYDLANINHGQTIPQVWYAVCKS